MCHCCLFANELHRKGFGTLIGAMAKIKSPSTRIDVVGRVSSGDYRRKIEDLGLTENVHWHGSTNDVFPYYAAADLLSPSPPCTSPSDWSSLRHSQVGFPSSRHGSLDASSAVDSGPSGRLLTDPTDIDELAACLAEGLDPVLRRRWESEAPGAAEPFAWPTIFREVEAVLRQAQLMSKTGR